MGIITRESPIVAKVMSQDGSRWKPEAHIKHQGRDLNKHNELNGVMKEAH